MERVIYLLVIYSYDLVTQSFFQPLKCSTFPLQSLWTWLFSLPSPYHTSLSLVIQCLTYIKDLILNVTTCDTELVWKGQKNWVKLIFRNWWRTLEKVGSLRMIRGSAMGWDSWYSVVGVGWILRMGEAHEWGLSEELVAVNWRWGQGILVIHWGCIVGMREKEWSW